MHSVHDDVHTVGLQDNCEACAAHASKPWARLDSKMLASLVRRNYFYRFGQKEAHEYQGTQPVDYAPRSDNEALAMAEITNVMEQMGALMSVDEDALIQSYLERKWGIEFYGG